MLNHYMRINSVENFKSNTHSVEKRAKEAIAFMFGKYAINKLFLNIFYKLQCLHNDCVKEKVRKEVLDAIDYNRNFFGELAICTGIGIPVKSRLQKFLSKREMSIFNKLASPMDYTSIFELFIYCKCAVNGLDKDIADAILKKLRFHCSPGNAHVFPIPPRWQYYDGERILNITETSNFQIFEGATRLVSFMAAWKDKVNPNILGDILDFLLAKNFEFNFKGRTFNSLVNCVINWHMELNRLENEKRINEKNSFSAPYPRGPFRDWFTDSVVNDAKVFCRQIRSYKTLCEEGRRQHHCVASYHGSCAAGQSFIYTLRKFDKKEGESVLATIEINPQGEILQARGLLNHQVKGETANLIKSWQKERKSYA